MIEFPITLTSGGSVCMPGYVFALALGYTKNLGVYRLHVDATGEWEGLTIRCFWHVPDGKDPSSSLVVDGYVDVPASVTAQPGSGCITFEGSDDTKNITSADLHYRVSANSGTEDGTEPEPGTPAWQQLVDAVHTDATAAEQAKTDAQTAAQQAGASAQKAGNALSDTITAKEDALKATKDAQTAASEASASAENAALAQVTASQLAGQAAGSASEAQNSATKAAASQQTAESNAAAAQGSATKAEASASTAVQGQQRAEAAAARAETAQQQTESASTDALDKISSAKTDALKAIGDKQTAATQAVDTARDKALQQVGASTEAAQTAANKAATSAGNADQSAQKAAGSLQELKNGIASGDFKGEPGNDGKSPVVTVTDIENGHRVSITDKDGTKTIDVLNGQTGKTGATPVLTIGTVSSGDKPSADITGTPENPVLNLMLQPGPQGPSVALDTTLTHEGEAADAKATGDAISAVKARQNILVGTETGNPLSVDDAFPAPLCGLTVYGKSTQDGTPTPDAPVPIVSAGDSGSVAVTLSDGNGKTQTLILPTPNGLPGIPVTSGGNYTDSTCQQWVCDEVDLERGVKVQRIGKERVNTSDGGINEQYRLALDIPGNEGKDGASPCIISITPYTSWTSCVAGTKLYLKNITKPEGGFYTAEELRALAIDVDFVYQLATPIETPLTPAEIAAYKAIATYAPDTVVQASDGAGVKLEYQRDVNLVVKNLEDAIASMTTT